MSFAILIILCCMNLKAWIVAFRLRTLALSFALIIMGSSIAFMRNCFSSSTLLLALLTTLLLQILSNLSNDYGDAVHGADGAGRVGPDRMVQSGAISHRSMRIAIFAFAAMSFASGVALLYTVYSRVGVQPVAVLLAVGVLCIVAAITYTMGKHPYGYSGFGDISVFIFFGLVGVAGSYTLYAGYPSWDVFIPASAIGLLSVGVLNMNNMRDHESDQRAGKRTVVVRMGIVWAKRYQCFLIISACLLLSVFVIFFGNPWQLLSIALTLPIWIKHLLFVVGCTQPPLLDSQLKVVSVGTFVVTFLFFLTSFL